MHGHLRIVVQFLPSFLPTRKLCDFPRCGEGALMTAGWWNVQADLVVKQDVAGPGVARG